MGKTGKLGAEPLSLGGRDASINDGINDQSESGKQGSWDAGRRGSIEPIDWGIGCLWELWGKNLLNCHPFRLSCPLLGCNIVQLFYLVRRRRDSASMFTHVLPGGIIFTVYTAFLDLAIGQIVWRRSIKILIPILADQ